MLSFSQDSKVFVDLVTVNAKAIHGARNPEVKRSFMSSHSLKSLLTVSHK